MSEEVCAFPQSQVRPPQCRRQHQLPPLQPPAPLPIAPCPSPMPTTPCPSPCATRPPAHHPLPITLRPSPCAHRPLPAPMTWAGLAQFQGYFYKLIFSDILTFSGEGKNKVLSHKVLEKRVKTRCKANNTKYVIFWVAQGFSAWQHCQFLMAVHPVLNFCPQKFHCLLERICPSARGCSADVHCTCSLCSARSAGRHPGVTLPLPERIIFCFICGIFD